jgi:hypothetical protein
MSKCTVLVLVILVACVRVYAGRESAEELAAALEAAVVRASVGDAAGAARMINAETRLKKLPALSAQAEQLKDAYRKLANLGESDGVERVSLKFLGESLFRLRAVDKRPEGLVLWTFIGYRLKGEWHCKGFSFKGSEDVSDFVAEAFDPADFQVQK